jgi:hypothetical protein
MGMSYRTLALLALVPLLATTGCQVQTIPTTRLIQHQALADLSGLDDTKVVEVVKAHVAAPRKWDQLNVKRGSIYTDQQWRSPTTQTGVGVAYIRLPLPLPAKALVWLAKKEYAKRGEQGEILAQWTDQLGRPWFEAQNDRYHIRGYAITRGFEAWIIYCGYKRNPDRPPSAAELGVAARALETIVPTPFAQQVPQRPLAAMD